MPTSTPLDYGAFEALTFDCHGTLIDWEAGLIAAFRPILAARSGSDSLSGRKPVQWCNHHQFCATLRC